MSAHTIQAANPGAGYLARKAEIDEAVAEVLGSGWYILGKKVASFEKVFSNFVGARFGIGVASGTDALLLALRSCGVGPGDAVVTVSHTAVATVAAIVMAGAVPILVDIDVETFTIDAAALEATLAGGSELTIKAVVPVHLYGHPADMGRVLDLAREYGIHVVEDCAQAHGARIGDQMTGSFGDLGAYSFYPTKNLAALGDGGAVVTNNPQFHERANMLRQYGWRERYVSETTGMNSRLDEIQAAILQVKLKHLHADNERRREIAREYNRRLSETNLVLPRERKGCYHVYHQYVVRTPRRDALKQYLAQQGVGASILYPQPVHLQAGYAPLIRRGVGELQVSEMVCDDLLCLPIYPELTDREVARVCDAILEWEREN